MTLRPKVQAFAEEMERQLRLNDEKGGWDHCDVEFLRSELTNHLCLLMAFVKRHRENPLAENGLAAIFNDAADVANFAMMIADVCGALTWAKSPEVPY